LKKAEWKDELMEVKLEDMLALTLRLMMQIWLKMLSKEKEINFS
jgi:hypothetical protein